MKIYIILTYTGTVLSKIIKLRTHDEFSHVSIALDRNLKKMYSFGRLNPYNPFIGGFVHEYIDSGTFKRFKNTRAKIIELEISEKKYAKIKSAIRKIELNKDKYKFNVLGLFAVGLNIKLRFNNSFYCAEFVKYVIDNANVGLELPELIRPENFKEIQGKVVYTGFLREYNEG